MPARNSPRLRTVCSVVSAEAAPATSRPRRRTAERSSTGMKRVSSNGRRYYGTRLARKARQLGPSEPGPAACVKLFHLLAFQARHIRLDRVADPGLQIGEVPIALGEALQQRAVQLQPGPTDRPGRGDPSRRSAGATRCPSVLRASRGSRRNVRCRPRRRARHPPWRAARWSSWSARSRARRQGRSRCRRGSAGC